MYTKYLKSRKANSERVNPELDVIALKWGYDPSRRYENNAGFDPITGPQMNFINSLVADRESDKEELLELFRGYWGVDGIKNWTKADAMFVIPRLISTELDADTMINDWFAQIRKWRGGEGEGWQMGKDRWRRKTQLWDDTHVPQLIDKLDNGEPVVFWDRDVPRYPTTIDDVSGVYVWFEFEMIDNSHLPIYVGQSEAVFNRLYVHYWQGPSKVKSFIAKQTKFNRNVCERCGRPAPAIYTEWRDNGIYHCDCLLRYWLVIVPSGNLRALERKYIKKFEPELNISQNWKKYDQRRRAAYAGVM